jgi:hypothetical protein
MPENDESRLAAMAKMVADHMHCLEEAVRRLVPRMEAEGHAYPGRSSVAAQGGRGATVVPDKGQTGGVIRMERGRVGGGTCRQVCGLEQRTDEGRARIAEGEGPGADPAARDAVQRGKDPREAGILQHLRCGRPLGKR